MNMEIETYPLTKEAVYAFIKKQGDGVTFVELLRHFPNARGDAAWGDDKLNIFFWFWVSAEAVNLLHAMRVEGLIEMKPTVPLTYLIDGAVPPYKVLKRLSKKRFAKPRWAPVIFNHVPGKLPCAA